MAPRSTVWPNDVVNDPSELERDSPHSLVCFLLSPFAPREVFDPVFAAVQEACSLCARNAGVSIECRRADTLFEAKAIHDDIWRHIAGADVLVVDVTGLNPNVMIEFGVAAALRRPTQVILIKAADDDTKLPFNAFAQRYIQYRRSILGDPNFLVALQLAMVQAITPAPYVPQSQPKASADGFRLDLRSGDRPDLLLSPAITHRRSLEDGIEYGSFLVFRNSWLLLGAADYRNVRVVVKFRFGQVLKQPDAFIGISLRNQHYHANWGHLALVGVDGRVWRTEPEDDGGKYHERSCRAHSKLPSRKPRLRGTDGRVYRDALLL